MTEFKTIKARFESNCGICSGMILEGDEVRWRKGSKAIHPGCEEPGDFETSDPEADMVNAEIKAGYFAAINEIAGFNEEYNKLTDVCADWAAERGVAANNALLDEITISNHTNILEVARTINGFVRNAER
jgi:hypothetical protein